MTAQRTAFSIALAVKRLSRRRRRDQVLQALHRIVESKRGSGLHLGASIHEIQKTLPDLQHSQIGRELLKAQAELAVEVAGFRRPRGSKIWNLSKCKVCGCDQLHACGDGDVACSWVSPNLCSRCAA